MYCDKCGQGLREGARFCPKCGTRFVSKEEFVAQANSNDYSNIESYKDRYENTKYGRGESVSKPKKKTKLIVFFSIAGLLVVSAVTAIILIMTLNSGGSANKVYKKYFQVLENERDSIVEFENECGANGVAFYDVNRSGVSDVLYITKNDTTESDTDRWYLHCLTDREEDIDIDIEEDISGGMQSWETLFLTDTDNCIYVLNKNRMYTLTYGKDESGKNTYLVEMIALREYDDEDEKYSCTILSDSGEMESVSEDKFDEYIDDICGRNVTILISTLTDEELEEVFTNIDEDISDNYDHAIEMLKNNDIAPVGNDDKNESETGTIEEETVIPEAEEKDRNFVKDHQLVEYDDVVYYVDDEGLWKKEIGSDSELLSEGSATNLATDGRVIYYGVFNEEVPYQYGKQQISINQYDMYRYDLKTGTNEKLTSFIEAGRPICAIGDMVYYTDYSDDFDGNMAGLAQGLRSYNMSTGEKEYICDGAHLVDSWNNKIFYREIMAAGGGYGVHQIHCYDTETCESEIISDDDVMSFKVASGKVYYVVSNSYRTTSADTQFYCYDIESGETEEIFNKPISILGNYTLDDQYLVYFADDKIIRMDLKSGDEEEIPLSELNGNKPNGILRSGDSTVFLTGKDSKRIYIVADDSLNAAGSNDVVNAKSILKVKGNTVFYSDYNHYYFYKIEYREIN